MLIIYMKYRLQVYILARIALIIIVIKSPLLGLAQTNIVKQEVKWEVANDWNEIKTKARVEKKFIFIDCYTTWCKPCKWMDMNVYNRPIVAQCLNEKFISIRAQMDTSVSDDDKARGQYAFSK